MRVTSPIAQLTSWLTGLRESLARRVRRFFVVSAFVAMAMMLAAPAVIASEAPEAEALDPVVLEQAGMWDGTALDDTAWTNSTVMLAPLYLRIPEPDLLNSSVRSTIFEHVSNNPGATFSQIRATVGAATGTVQHHLRVLVRGGVLRRVRTGKYTRYYPANHRVLALPPSQERLVRSLAREGPATKAELARRLDMSRQLVHYHVERLEGKGLLRVERNGGHPVINLGVPRSDLGYEGNH